MYDSRGGGESRKIRISSVCVVSRASRAWSFNAGEGPTPHPNGSLAVNEGYSMCGHLTFSTDGAYLDVTGPIVDPRSRRRLSFFFSIRFPFIYFFTLRTQVQLLYDHLIYSCLDRHVHLSLFLLLFLFFFAVDKFRHRLEANAFARFALIFFPPETRKTTANWCCWPNCWTSHEAEVIISTLIGSLLSSSGRASPE